MPLLHHDFRRFLDALDDLNPAQVEDAQTKIRDLRRKTEAISEIEARTNQEHKCPFAATSDARSGVARGLRSSATDAPAARRPIPDEPAAPSLASIAQTCSWSR
jgi:hypothetical protein